MSLAEVVKKSIFLVDTRQQHFAASQITDHSTDAIMSFEELASVLRTGPFNAVSFVDDDHSSHSL